MYMYTHTHQPSPVVRDMAVNITLSPLSESWQSSKAEPH
jgi:hypothetical protein